jgi:hypothetical protein
MTDMRDVAEPDLSNVAFIFTCDRCAGEFFPDTQLPKIAEVLGDRDWGWDGEMRSAVVHAACTAGFMANGFEIVDPVPDPALGLELYCPHHKWDAALDEWAVPGGGL